MSEDEIGSERPTEDHIIRSWLTEYAEEADTEGGIPYWKIQFKQYPEALNALMQSFIKNGYKEADLDSTSLLRKIQKKITAMGRDTQKLEKWNSAIEYVWNFYLDKEFADSSILAPAKNYEKKSKKPKVEEEEIPQTTYVPPKSKLDPNKFQGFGDAQFIEDEGFSKLFEDLKDE